MRFGVLGPVEVGDGDRLLPVAGGLRRGLLAALLLERGRPVSTEALITALWERTPPSSARTQVQAMVGVLRRLFADAGWPGLLVTRPPGYLIDVPAAALDLTEFEAAVAEGRRAAAGGRHTEAAEAL
ncbi:MAG TPA: winged helix-turn-helix domain-containing protein, partial [Pseudonocardiaceae bacterium]